MQQLLRVLGPLHAAEHRDPTDVSCRSQLRVPAPTRHAALPFSGDAARRPMPDVAPLLARRSRRRRRRGEPSDSAQQIQRAVQRELRFGRRAPAGGGRKRRRKPVLKSFPDFCSAVRALQALQDPAQPGMLASSEGKETRIERAKPRLCCEKRILFTTSSGIFPSPPSADNPPPSLLQPPCQAKQSDIPSLPHIQNMAGGFAFRKAPRPVSVSERISSACCSSSMRVVRVLLEKPYDDPADESCSASFERMYFRTCAATRWAYLQSSNPRSGPGPELQNFKGEEHGAH